MVHYNNDVSLHTAAGKNHRKVEGAPQAALRCRDANGGVQADGKGHVEEARKPEERKRQDVGVEAVPAVAVCAPPRTCHRPHRASQYR